MPVRAVLIAIPLLLATLANGRADAIAAPPLNCANATFDTTIRNAVVPYYPDSARDLGLGPATVLVSVMVNADGSVNAARIEKSSGNSAIDQSALRAARASTYAPKFVNCVAMDGGGYLFRADFNPGRPSPAPMGTLECPTPNRDAAIVHLAQPVFPDAAKNLGVGAAAVIVQVSIDQNSTVRSVRVAQSSGNSAIDGSALDAARASTYSPRVLGCQSFSSDLTFRIIVAPGT